MRKLGLLIAMLVVGIVAQDASAFGRRGGSCGCGTSGTVRGGIFKQRTVVRGAVACQPVAASPCQQAGFVNVPPTTSVPLPMPPSVALPVAPKK